MILEQVPRHHDEGMFLDYVLVSHDEVPEETVEIIRNILIEEFIK